MNILYLSRFLAISAIYLFASAAQAATDDTTGTATPPVIVAASTTGGASTMPSGPTLSGSSGTSQVGRLGARFASFAGSTENAESLVQGLRSGGEITLGANGGEAVTFTPPTRHMGWGNVSKALSLAQAQLAAQGIGNPTPEQLKTALLGGTLTSDATGGTGANTVQMQGVLALRSQGMGWGRIARTLGVRPDGRPVVQSGSGGTLSGRGVITTAAGGTLARQDPRYELRGREAGARGRDEEMRTRFQPETGGRGGEQAFRSEARIHSGAGASSGIVTTAGGVGGSHGGALRGMQSGRHGGSANGGGSDRGHGGGKH